MSFLVILKSNSSFYSSQTSHHYVVESLEEIKLPYPSVVSIDAVYEIIREVPVTTKYEEETIVVKTKPYLDIDGIKIPIADSGTLTTGTLTVSNGNDPFPGVTASCVTRADVPHTLTKV